MNERNMNDHQPYDIIGDIHGYADVLEALLRKLGYEKPNGIWRHPEGLKVLFLGDFIDRGPSIPRTLKIVRDMVENGEARAIMGNHEYNALLYHTRGADGDWLRRRVPKNVNQHAATLAQFWGHQDEWEGYLKWFATLPLWADLGGLRAVHANWDDRLVNANPDWRFLNEELLHRSVVKNSPECEHCDILLKGAEAELPMGGFLTDKEQNIRTKMRLRWWLPAKGRTYYELCMPLPDQSDNVPHEVVPVTVEALCPGYAEDAPPLFFGHYWLPFEESAELIAPNVACLDFSVAKDGALTAYRWDGEQRLDAAKFVQVRATEVAK
jgi:Calcineurin-like phosphoesterase